MNMKFLVVAIFVGSEAFKALAMGSVHHHYPTVLRGQRAALCSMTGYDDRSGPGPRADLKVMRKSVDALVRERLEDARGPFTVQSIESFEGASSREAPTWSDRSSLEMAPPFSDTGLRKCRVTGMWEFSAEGYAVTCCAYLEKQ